MSRKKRTGLGVLVVAVLVAAAYIGWGDALLYCDNGRLRTLGRWSLEAQVWLRLAGPRTLARATDAAFRMDSDEECILTNSIAERGFAKLSADARRRFGRDVAAEFLQSPCHAYGWAMISYWGRAMPEGVIGEGLRSKKEWIREAMVDALISRAAPRASEQDMAEIVDSAWKEAQRCGEAGTVYAVLEVILWRPMDNVVSRNRDALIRLLCSQDKYVQATAAKCLACDQRLRSKGMYGRSFHLTGETPAGIRRGDRVAVLARIKPGSGPLRVYGIISSAEVLGVARCDKSAQASQRAASAPWGVIALAIRRKDSALLERILSHSNGPPWIERLATDAAVNPDEDGAVNPNEPDLQQFAWPTSGPKPVR